MAQPDRTIYDTVTNQADLLEKLYKHSREIAISLRRLDQTVNAIIQAWQHRQSDGEAINDRHIAAYEEFSEKMEEMRGWMRRW
ncbi:hypothetical protein EJ08DRAFT_693425 [Tothia fuscella]|uniref:Uncharacterized protein n=1 Tax=Tothia fuscella TaxID=1048955 RepID=A0A9P4P0B9_9PEZI|nr:hypothetical protein EJ08DRAFT_693425 [Tothia fuscella]